MVELRRMGLSLFDVANRTRLPLRRPIGLHDDVRALSMKAALHPLYLCA